MSTYYNNILSQPRIDFKKAIKLARNDTHIDPLLFDLLTTISPHGKEMSIAKIIKSYAENNVKQFKIIAEEKEHNLIIKIGNSNVMFSSHMDTVQSRVARETNELFLTEDNYVYAGYPKEKRIYLDAKKQSVEQEEMEKEAEDIGMSFRNYVMHNGILYGSDDDFDGWTNTGLKFTYKTVTDTSSTILGADDKLGCYIMCRMMKEGISGLYVFHVGEEAGGVGSSYLASERKELFTDIDYCVAFDRKGYNDVIHRQSGGECCSTQFASAVCDAMNAYLPPKEQAEPSSLGSFTDSANYTELIAECTNLPVGYFDQHTSSEYFDLEWLERYAIPAYINMPWTDLPVKRNPVKKFNNLWSGYSGNRNRNYGRYDFFDNDEMYNKRFDNRFSSSSLINKVSRTKNTQRRTNQSAIDKIAHQLNNLQEYTPEDGFASEENHGQRVKRVLYSLISQNLTLEEIAELVVDTYENAENSSFEF